MNYLQLLAAYNTLKSKLLIKSFILQNLHQLDEYMLHGALLDFRLYNPNITFKENRKIKLDLAKKINYPGTIILGNVEEKMLYKCEVIEKGISQKVYYPYGLQKMDEEFNFVYKFSERTYTKTVRSQLHKLFQFVLPYGTAREKFARLYNTTPAVRQYITLVEYSSASEEKDEEVSLTITLPEGKRYVSSCLTFMNVKHEVKKEGIVIWP